MKKITSLTEFKALSEPVALAIGNFDGMHLGHRALFNSLLKAGKNKKIKTCILTLNPHPYLFIHSNTNNYLINSKEEMYLDFEKMGIDYLWELTFDDSLKSTSAKEFIDKFILENEVIKHLHLGHDFALGAGKEDAYEMLLNSSYNFSISREEKLKINDKICSSSNVRSLVMNGEIAMANLMLGRNFYLNGEVVSGLGIGGKDLVPTANLSWDLKRLVPCSGVYFSNTIVDGDQYPSITNIGHSPTVVENGQKRIETFLLDYNENLYSKAIKVEFLSFHRNEQKFNSKEELLKQINNDIAMRKAYKC